ncbi:MAG TPA: hypothetical protein RMG45_29295, partial [Polyangiaceae bacterium LLY-WYZ-15_(1-7)]|nr:hypothetical protein [Polyangiaceae bacterium LLY-WYZ-15_(1-7)]
WEALPALPTPRSSHDAIALGDALYVVGGWAMDGAPDDAPFHEAMLRFADGRWETLPGPTPRRALALAATDGHLVAVGGMAPDGSVVSTVEVFDPEAGTWAPGPDLPSPPEAGPGAGFGVAAVGVGDAVYASGRDGALVRWRVGEESWTRVGALRFPRFFHRLVARGEQLLALGGIGGMHTHGRTRLVEAIGTDGERPGRVLLTLPWAGEAKNRQGMFLLGDHLYLFGGNDSLGQHDFDAEHFVAEGVRLHIPSMNVEARAAYPVRRQTMTTVPIDEDTVWLLGGFGHEAGGESGESGAPSEEGETVARTHPEIYAYDAEADAWSLRARLPVARSQAGAVRHGGTLFAIGGLDYDPRRPEEARFDHLTEVVALEEGAEAFAPIDAPLPGPRRAFGGAALGDRYVMVGGMREGFQLVEDCAAFDLEQRAFEDFPCPARPRLNPQLLTVGERLVLLGGTIRLDDGELGEDRSIEVFEDGAWRTLEAELPFTPKHARAFAHRGGVLVVSTHVEEDVIRLAFLDLE